MMRAVTILFFCMALSISGGGCASDIKTQASFTFTRYKSMKKIKLKQDKKAVKCNTIKFPNGSKVCFVKNQTGVDYYTSWTTTIPS